jgi:4-aminobutyrate aminotransferase/(S)-3-amino-2-methylpropionate transaminase
MAQIQFDLKPKTVARVETKYRKIVTQLPAPASLPVLEKLRANEPISMSGQPPVVWDRAEGIQVYDQSGNVWIDWSSGVLVTNAGHGRKEVAAAIMAQAQKPLLHTYCFPNEPRAELAERLVRYFPKKPAKAFILTTGAETTECAIKLARTYAIKKHGWSKRVFVSFTRAFHGRTLGSQLAGGIPALKTWILEPAKVAVGPGGVSDRPETGVEADFVNVPFPDGFRTSDTSFDLFLSTLDEQGVKGEDVCGVMSETYQGGDANFLPPDYATRLRAWCDEHDALLIMDEVQAGFGRTGTFWGFEHYGWAPDLACCGKGISSSLPISAIIGRADVMDLYGPGEMTSTHTGNPVTSAAAVASIDLIVKEKLAANAAKMGKILLDELSKIAERYEFVGSCRGRGLVASIQIVKPGTTTPDPETAFKIVEACFHRGVLMFAPVGTGNASVKIAPPLVITEEPLRESIAVLAEAFKIAAGKR